MTTPNKEFPSHVLEFFATVTPRVGPLNAMGLLQDVQLTAYRRILTEELGIADERIEMEVQKQIKEMAQNIMKMPVPSPIQPNNVKN